MAMMTMTTITRQERRARRLRKLVTVKQAKFAARLAKLDYKTSGESGALKLRGKVVIRESDSRKNGYAPPPGRQWSRSGPTYVTETEELGVLPKPIILHRWRALNKDR